MDKKKISLYKIVSWKVCLVLVLSLLVLALFSYIVYLAYFWDKIFPGVKIASIDVGGLKPDQAYIKVLLAFQTNANTNLTLIYQGQQYSLNLATTQPKLDVSFAVQKAYLIGKSGSYIKDLQEQFTAAFSTVVIQPSLNFSNQPDLETQLNTISSQLKKEPVNARVILANPVAIQLSQDGQELDQAKLLSEIKNFLSLKGNSPHKLMVKILPASFNSQAAQNYQSALERVKQKPIKLVFENQTWILDQTKLFSMMDLQRTQSNIATLNIDNLPLTIKEITVGQNKISDKEVVLDHSAVQSYLQAVADKIDQPTQEARFNFDSQTGRVVEFQPAIIGKKLDQAQAEQLLIQAVNNTSLAEIKLPVIENKPKLTTADVNSFGIKDLLGRGFSHFNGSISNRIYNLSLAASRLNGALIEPGSIFSFNSSVGDVSSATGYKQAYIIKEGRTVLDDGGGVCQVSTTLFRAVLNAGLPVVARTAHAYRVGYYEQGFPPGLDATVFFPSVDFKFKNDTARYILVQAYVKGYTLYVDLYGASDGRQVTLTKPVILEQTPPLPEIRQDDPTLPKGTIKQVDWPAWGAKVVFDRTVTRSGEEIIKETWRSNFRPWQAIFLVGTKE